jgi:hypothetical protein
MTLRTLKLRILAEVRSTARFASPDSRNSTPTTALSSAAMFPPMMAPAMRVSPTTMEIALSKVLVDRLASWSPVVSVRLTHAGRGGRVQPLPGA